MDDMNTFERQVARDALRDAGPSLPVDAAAVFARAVTAPSPKWRFQSMFSATKFVVAGAIVALFGGFLLAGVLDDTAERGVGAGGGHGRAGHVQPDRLARRGDAVATPPRSCPTAASSSSGGVNGNRDTVSSEVWDPATASFEPAGRSLGGACPTPPRCWPTAVSSLLVVGAPTIWLRLGGGLGPGDARVRLGGYAR